MLIYNGILRGQIGTYRKKSKNEAGNKLSQLIGSLLACLFLIDAEKKIDTEKDAMPLFTVMATLNQGAVPLFTVLTTLNQGAVPLFTDWRLCLSCNMASCSYMTRWWMKGEKHSVTTFTSGKLPRKRKTIKSYYMNKTNI